MIEFQTVINNLQEYGQLYIKGNDISLRCPLCGDSKKSKLKKRFHVTWNPDGTCAFHCFNCSKTGTFAELISELKGISIGEAIRSIETVEFDDVKQLLTKQPSASKIIERKEESNFNFILNDCISIHSDISGYIDGQYKKQLTDFINKRKIPKEYNIYIATKGEYKNRFIIPIYHKNNIVYFQGRAMNNDMLLRFKNPTVEKSNIIMNVDHFNRDKFIIVTEGIIDAMMISDHQGTCVLGGSVSDEFLTELYKHTDKGIIVSVDHDERGDKERVKLSTESKYKNQLFFFVPPSPVKDLNEMVIKGIGSNDMYEHIVNNKINSFTFITHHTLMDH